MLKGGGGVSNKKAKDISLIMWISFILFALYIATLV